MSLLMNWELTPLALESLWESACLEYVEQVRRLQDAPYRLAPFYPDLSSCQLGLWQISLIALLIC
jgi:hypothetical protein